MKKYKAGVFIPPSRKPWPHEERVAKILARAGHYIEFQEEGNLPSADIRMDGVEYEIKSPESFNTNTLEHTIKDAINQSPRIIIDTSRMKRIHDSKVKMFLMNLVCRQNQIKGMILITKRGEIIDIFK